MLRVTWGINNTKDRGGISSPSPRLFPPSFPGRAVTIPHTNINHHQQQQPTHVTRTLCDAEGHTSVVGDVAWHQQNPKVLGSVGDDRQLLFWDTSVDGAKPTTVIPNVRREEKRV